MNRVVMLVDGFNLYHALNDHANLHRFKWLDLTKLANCFLTKNDKITDIYYFTALFWKDPSKVSRHKKLLKVYEDKGIKIVPGVFRRKERRCSACMATVSTTEEKRTDVNIAVMLMDLAFDDKFDTALILSGDSDLIPAINAVKARRPDKEIGVIVPIGRRAKELRQHADSSKKIKRHHLVDSQIDRPYVTADGRVIPCPESWH